MSGELRTVWCNHVYCTVGRAWAARGQCSQKVQSGLTCPLLRGPPFPASVGATLTFAVCDVGGTIKIGAGVARTGDAMVLAKLRLIGAHGTTDAPVGGGIVVVARRAVDCRGTCGGVLVGEGRGAPVF